MLLTKQFAVTTLLSSTSLWLLLCLLVYDCWLHYILMEPTYKDAVTSIQWSTPDINSWIIIIGFVVMSLMAGLTKIHALLILLCLNLNKPWHTGDCDIWGNSIAIMLFAMTFIVSNCIDERHSELILTNLMIAAMAMLSQMLMCCFCLLLSILDLIQTCEVFLSSQLKLTWCGTNLLAMVRSPVGRDPQRQLSGCGVKCK